MKTIYLDFKANLSLDKDNKVPCHIYITADVKWNENFYVDEMYIDRIEHVSTGLPVDIDSISDSDKDFIHDKAFELAEEELERMDLDNETVNNYVGQAYDDQFELTLEETKKNKYH